MHGAWINGELFAGQALEAVRSADQPRGGGASPTGPLVARCSNKDAEAMVQAYHYTRRMPSGKIIPFGWYTPDLYACAVYGIGVNPYIYGFLKREAGYDCTEENLLELRRLVRIEPRNPKLQLTQFIAQCHRILRREGIRFIIAYSDPSQGHDGTIYKAANFEHIGRTNTENHAVDSEGQVRHRRFYGRYAKRHGITVGEARKQLGLSLIKRPGKDRWIIRL